MEIWVLRKAVEIRYLLLLSIYLFRENLQTKNPQENVYEKQKTKTEMC